MLCVMTFQQSSLVKLCTTAFAQRQKAPLGGIDLTGRRDDIRIEV